MKSDVQAIMDKIRNLLAQGETEEALAILDNNIEEDPECYVNYMLKGVIQCVLKDETGIFNLKYAVELSGTVDTYLNLGLGYQNLGDLDGEEATYREALEIYPDDERLNMNLMGILLEDRENFEEGYQLALHAFELSPNSDACFGLAYASESLKNLEEAKKWYLKGLEFDDNSESAYNDAAIFFEFHGDKELAYNIYLRGLDTYPTSALLWYNYGCWYVHNQEEDKALECFKKSFDLDNHFTAIYYDDTDKDVTNFVSRHPLEDWYKAK